MYITYLLPSGSLAHASEFVLSYKDICASVLMFSVMSFTTY